MGPDCYVFSLSILTKVLEIFEHPYWPQLYEGAWKTRNAPLGKQEMTSFPTFWPII